MGTDDQTIASTSDQASNQAGSGKLKGTRKAKTKASTEGKGKRSLNLSLPVEDYQRLALHAVARDTTISELVSSLAREHLREWHLTRTATRATAD